MSKFEFTNNLINFNQHNSSIKIQELLMNSTQKSIALASDAGMPSICDPGKLG